MLDTLPDDGRQCDVKDKCMELFKKYGNQPDMLNLKLAQHTADDWAELYRFDPTIMPVPHIIKRYQSLKTDAERKEFNKQNPDWLNSQEMKDYDQGKGKVDLKNKENQRWLEEQRVLLDDDPVRRAKIDVVLAKYPTSSVRVETPPLEWQD